MDRFVIAMIANSLYEEELGKRLGINPHSEYGRKRLNEYLEEERKSDELSAKIHLHNSNPGKFISYTEIRGEAGKIRQKRLEPYIQEATRIHKEREEQKKKEIKTVKSEFTKEKTMEQLRDIRTQLSIQYDDLLEKCCELEEKLKIKSTAKTRTKRIEDKISMKIELEKLNNRMKLLSRTIDAYDTKISLGNYNIITPSTDLAISTIEENNRELLQLLEKEYEKLDILSTKKVLASQFGRVRLKGINKYDFGPFPFAGGLFSSLFIGIPFQNIVNLPFSVSNLLLGLGIPFVAGFGATSYGIVKSTKQKKEAFDNLNNKLDEERLIDEISLDYDTYKERIKINQLVDSKIQEIMIILMNQKENEMILESSKKETKQTKKTDDMYIDLLNEIEVSQKQSGPVLTRKLTPQKKK